MNTCPLTLDRPIFVPASIYCAGQVIAIGPEGFAVRGEAGVLGARRAASCLLSPEMGDTVLVGGDNTERVYIIAVLERANSSPMRLSVEGDLQVTAGGTLSIDGRTGLTLSTPEHCVLAADELTVRGSRATLLIEKLCAIGSEIGVTVARLRFVGHVMESLVDRFMLTAKQSLRVVEGTDQLRSGSIDYRAKQTMNLHGRNFLASAKELVKVDGSQIHLG